MFFFVTFYLQRVQGFTPLATGLAFMPMVVTIVVTSVSATTRLVPAVGSRVVVPAGMATGAVGLVLLVQLTTTSGYVTGVLLGMVLVGLGYGAVLAPSISRATAGVLPQHTGAASGLVATSQQVGLAVGRHC